MDITTRNRARRSAAWPPRHRRTLDAFSRAAAGAAMGLCLATVTPAMAQDRFADAAPVVPADALPVDAAANATLQPATPDAMPGMPSELALPLPSPVDDTLGGDDLERDDLEPGEYRWMPERALDGPMVVVVSLPEQRLHVYRNGVRIGLSTISSGKPGHETPTGVYPILQKEREHYSNLYNSAPMPYMQRLTWDGIAMHAGNLPGNPASHGCIRLPLEFSKKLFAVTDYGMIVVVADAMSHGPDVVRPGKQVPVDYMTGLAFNADARDPLPDNPVIALGLPDGLPTAAADPGAPRADNLMTATPE